jgi:hypothetical protein
MRKDVQRAILVWLRTHTPYPAKVKLIFPLVSRVKGPGLAKRARSAGWGTGAVNAALQDPAIADSPARRTVGPPALPTRYICKTWRYDMARHTLVNIAHHISIINPTSPSIKSIRIASIERPQPAQPPPPNNADRRTQSDSQPVSSRI